MSAIIERSPARDRFPALDGLRAVGAFMVVVTHVGFQSGVALRGPFSGFLARLDAGVAVFFVISGFLLFRPHVVAHLRSAPRPDPLVYLWHRALRILPVFWIAVLAATLLVPTQGAAPSDVLLHAALVHIYFTDTQLHGLTQMWSLATEVAFYLALPVLAWCSVRGTPDRSWVLRRIAVFVGLVAVGAAWMAGSTALGLPRERLWLPGFVGWFGLGMALAVWQTARRFGILPRGILDALTRAPGTAWALAAALLALASTPIAGPIDLTAPTPGQAATKNVLYALVGLLVVLPGVTLPDEEPPRATAHLSGRIAHVLGSVSYGIFAYHVIVLGVVERWLGLGLFNGHFWTRLVLTSVVSLLLAIASFYGMERPLMRRGRRREKVETFLLAAYPADAPEPVQQRSTPQQSPDPAPEPTQR